MSGVDDDPDAHLAEKSSDAAKELEPVGEERRRDCIRTHSSQRPFPPFPRRNERALTEDPPVDQALGVEEEGESGEKAGSDRPFLLERGDGDVYAEVDKGKEGLEDA